MKPSMSLSLSCPLCGCSVSRGSSLQRVLFGSKAYSFCPNCGADHDPKERGWKTKVRNYLLKKGAAGVFSTTALGMTVLHGMEHGVGPVHYEYLKDLLGGTNLQFLLDDLETTGKDYRLKSSFEELAIKILDLG